MRVTGQHHQFLAQLGCGGQHDFALHGVAVPCVQVVAQLGVELGVQQSLLCIGEQRGGLGGGAFGGQVVGDGFLPGGQGIGAGVVGVEVRQDADRKLHARHQHLLAQHLPGGFGGRQLALQPLQLGAAHDGAAGGGQRGLRGGSGGWVEQLGKLHLFVAPDHTGVEHMQRSQTAEIEAAVDLHQIAGIGRTHGHPFVPGLDGCGAAGRKAAFSGGGVVFGTVFVGVVGHLVVVPHGNQRQAGAENLAVWVRAVLGVAFAVIGQVQALVGGFHHAAQCLGIGAGIAAGTVLVNEVTQVHGKLCARLGRFGIHIEVARRVVGATEHSQ